MKIKELEITNFRNIKHAIYNFGDTNIIEAKNHTGKTNTLTAPHWLLTDKLINNTSDDMSLKTIGNTSAPVSVKMTFIADDSSIHSIEKIYQEKWTKTRGSCELALTGHDIIYKIDEITQTKNITAKSEIAKLLNIDPTKMPSANVFQALMNPLYLPNQLDWKFLRAIIISIIGDVTNQDVYKSAPETMSIEPLLNRYSYDVEKVAIFCNQQIKGLNDLIIDLEAQIDMLSKTEDINPDELKALDDEIESKREMIKKLQNNEKNPMIDKLNDEISKMEVEASKFYNTEYNAYLDAKASANDEVNKCSDELRNKNNEMNAARTELSICEANETLATKESYDAKRKLQELNENLMALREDYRNLKNEVYQPLESVRCPHCNGILNEIQEEEHKTKWNEEHDKEIQDNINKGKALKLKIEEVQQDVAAKENKIIEEQKKKEELNATIEHLSREYSTVLNNYNNAKNNAPKQGEFTPSNAYFELKHKINELTQKKADLELEDESKNNHAAEIYNLNNEIEELKTKQGQHYVYLNAMNQASFKTAELKDKQKERASFEMEKELALLFNKTKLDILEARIHAHFGDEIEWVLVENNLKEGSWNTTCYPMIAGTKTPFHMGSTSEKVITGIKIIEIFKRELNLPDLPIVIDEIGELDNNSLANLRTITNAQIIATRVNDNYDDPTVINL